MMKKTTLTLAAMTALGLSSTASAATFVTNDVYDHERDPSVTDPCACVSVVNTCSLRAAVQTANLCPGADTIVLGSVHRLIRNGTGEDLAAVGDLDVLEDVEVVGSSSVIDDSTDDRTFHVLPSASGASVTLTIRGTTVHGRAAAGEDGGAIYAEGSAAVITDCQFPDNDAEDGGAIAVWKGALTVEGSTFEKGTAVRGGAIYAESARVTLKATAIVAGTAEDTGGAIHAVDSEVAAGELTVVESTAYRGGGIYSTGDGVLIIEEGSISDNSAGNGGGGLWTETDTTLIDVAITGNAAPYAAGALVYEATLQGSRLDVGANITQRNGGGLYGHRQARIELDHSTLRENEASGQGGGIYSSSLVYLYDVSIWRNLASRGSAIYGQGGSSFIYGNNVSVVENELPFFPTAAIDAVLARFRNSLMEQVDSCSPGVYSLGHVASADTDCLAGGAAGNVAAAPGVLPLTLGTGGVIVIPASSPAVDAGDDATCESDDQRYVSRPQGAHCDIGAYEVQP